MRITLIGLLLGNCQAFCNEWGEALSREQAGEQLARELELDRQMRMYHCHCDSHTCVHAVNILPT